MFSDVSRLDGVPDPTGPESGETGRVRPIKVRGSDQTHRVRSPLRVRDRNRDGSSVGSGRDGGTEGPGVDTLATPVS